MILCTQLDWFATNKIPWNPALTALARCPSATRCHGSQNYQHLSANFLPLTKCLWSQTGRTCPFLSANCPPPTIWCLRGQTYLHRSAHVCKLPIYNKMSCKPDFHTRAGKRKLHTIHTILKYRLTIAGYFVEIWRTSGHFWRIYTLLLDLYGVIFNMRSLTGIIIMYLK